MHRYNQIISKAFIATAGQQSWKQKYIFIKEPIRRPIIAKSASISSIGTNTVRFRNQQQNPFSYQKFDLNEITV